MENISRASKACGRCANDGWGVKNHVSCSTSTFSIMHAPYLPPKILHNHCFQFLLGRLQYPGEIKTKVMQNLRGQIRCIYGKCGRAYITFFLKNASLRSSSWLCTFPIMYAFPTLRDSSQKNSIRSLLYYLNEDEQFLIQTLGPFVPSINWESQYLGQVTSRCLLPLSQLRPRLYVETLAGV